MSFIADIQGNIQYHRQKTLTAGDFDLAMNFPWRMRSEEKITVQYVHTVQTVQ